MPALIAAPAPSLAISLKGIQIYISLPWIGRLPTGSWPDCGAAKQIIPGPVEGKRVGRREANIYNIVVSLGSCKSWLKQVTNKCTRHPGDFPGQTVKITKPAGTVIRANKVYIFLKIFAPYLNRGCYLLNLLGIELPRACKLAPRKLAPIPYQEFSKITCLFHKCPYLRKP